MMAGEHADAAGERGGWLAAGWVKDIRSAEASRTPRSARAFREAKRWGRDTNRCIAGAAVYFVGLVAVALIGSVVEPTFLPGLRPLNGRDSLMTLFQVQAALAAIALPLFFTVMPLARDDVLSPTSTAEILIEDTFISATISFAFAGLIYVGVAALWFESDVAKWLAFAAVLCPTVVGLGYAYLRAGRVLVDPESLRRSSLELLRRRLDESVVEFTAIELANGNLVRHLTERGVGRDWLGSGADDGSITFRTRRGGVIADLNSEALAAWLRRLPEPLGRDVESERVQSAEQPDQDVELHPVDVSLTILIGDQVSIGQRLAIVRGVDLSPATQSELERQLNSCIRIADDNTSAAERFSAEMAVLRDQLVGAVGARREAAIELGLRYLSQLMSYLLQQSALLTDQLEGQPRHAPTLSTLRGDRSPREIGDISGVVWPVLSESALEPRSSVHSRVLGTLRDLIGLAWSEDNYDALDQFVRLFPHLVEFGIDDSRVETGTLPTITATAIDETSRIFSGRVLFDRNRSRERQVEYADLVLRHSAYIGKLVVERGDLELARVWSEAFDQVFDLLRWDLDGPEDPRRICLVRKESVRLALIAWTLLLWQHGWTPAMRTSSGQSEPDSPDYPAVVGVLIGTPQHPETWLPLREALEQQTARNLGWQWWEVMRQRSGEFYALSYPDYLHDAALLIMGASNDPVTGLMTQVDQNDPESGTMARYLLTRSDDLETRYPELTTHSLRIAVPALRNIVSSIERDAEARVASLPLVDALVEAFLDSAEQALTPEGHFVGLLPCCDTADDTPKAPVLGFNQLASKHYFLTEEGHYADGASLARDIGNATVRRESEIVLQSLRSACHTITCSAAQFAAGVTSSVSSLRSTGFDPSIYVVRSYAAWELLRQDVLKTPALQSYDDPFEFDGTKYQLVNDGSEEFVLVADLSQLACFRRAAFEEGEASPYLYAGGTIFAAVALVDDATARKWALEEDPAPEGEALEREVRRLRQQAHIRTLVRPSSRIIDSRAGEILVLGDG